MITVHIGQDMAGYPRRIDLHDAAHVLIAGTTGMGKSTELNGMLYDLVSRYRPDEVTLQMFDPKRVELSMWDKAPHFKARSVSERSMADHMAALVVEMDRRYKEMEAKGQRRVAGDATRTIVVIDELAPLMLGPRRKDFSYWLGMLTSQGRAAGFHVIACTQHPTTEVITSFIKANIPTRLAFGTTSAVNSRVILDESGAENLRSPGQMLARLPGESGLTRLTGLYCTDAKIAGLLRAA